MIKTGDKRNIKKDIINIDGAEINDATESVRNNKNNHFFDVLSKKLQGNKDE